MAQFASFRHKRFVRLFLLASCKTLEMPAGLALAALHSLLACMSKT